MQQFETATEATTTALNSQGSGYRENEQYLKSLEARINRLKNAWTELTLSMGDASLTDIFIGIVSGLTRLANSTKWVVDNVGLLPLAFNIAGLAVLAFSSKARANIIAFGSTLGMTNRWINSVTLSTQLWATSTWGVNAATTALTWSVRALTVAFRALLSATLIGGGIALVGIALEKLITHISNTREEAKRLQEANEQTINSWINQKDKIDELLLSFQRLYNTKDRTIEQEQEYLNIQTQLSTLVPNLTAFTDENGQAHIFVGDALQRELELIEAIVEKEKERKLLNTEKDLSNIITRREDVEAQIAEIEKQLETGTKTVTHFGRTFSIDISPEELIDLEIELLKLRVTLGNLSDELEGEITEIIKTITSLSGIELDDGLTSQITNILGSLESLNNKSKSELNSIINNFAKFISLSKQASSMGHTQQITSGVYDELNKVLNELKDTFPDAIDLLNSFNIETTKTSSTIKNDGIPVFDQMDKYIGSIGGTAGDTKDKFKDLQEVFDDGVLVSYIGELYTLEDRLKEVSDSADDLISSIDSLASAYQTLQKGEELSHKTLQNLIKDYPQIAKYITETNDLTLKKGDIIKIVAEADNNAFLDSIDRQIAETKSLRENLNNRLKMYEEYYYGIYGSPQAAMGFAGVRLEQEIKLEGTESLSEIEDALSRLEATRKIFDKPFNLDNLSPTSRSSASSSKSPFSYITDEFAKEMDHLDTLIKQSAGRQSQYNDTSEEYRNELELQIELIKQKQELTKQEADRIRALNVELKNQRSALSPTSEEYQRLTQEIDNNDKAINQLSRSWWDLQGNIDSANKSIQDATEAQKRLNEEQQKLFEDNYNQQQSNLESAYNDAISAYKEYLQARQKLEKDALDNSKRALDKAHKENMDRLDKELKKYEDQINLQLQSLRRGEDERNHERELTKKQEEAQKLRDLISQRELDDTAETQSAVRKMREELTAKEEEIAEMVHNRQISLREENLRDALDKKKKEIQDQKDNARYAVEINGRMHYDLYENLIQRINDEQEALDRYYNEELNNERKFASLREEVLQGNLTNLQTLLNDFSTDVSATMSALGENIQQNLIDKLNQASRALGHAGMNIVPSGGNRTQQQDYNADFQRYITNKVLWEKEFQATGKKDSATQKRLNEENRQLREKHGYADYTIDQIRNMSYSWLDKLIPFDTGGYTGDFAGGKIGILHRKELVLDENDTSNMLETVNVTRNIIDSIRANIPKFDKLIQNRNLQAQPSSTSLQFDKFIHIEKIEKDVDVDRMFRLIDNRFKQWGINLPRR